MKTLLRNQRGISIVEVLVVLAVMGLVMAAVYGFYESQMKTSHAQEEVVEVQQNLRIAMDMITRDIKKAGFLVPSGTNPLGTCTDASVTVNTSSSTAISGMVYVSSALALTSPVNITMDSAESVDRFTAHATTGDLVRIIRPESKSPVISAIFRVTGKDRTVPRLTLTWVSGTALTGTETTKKGDIIARTSSSTATTTNTIAYSLLDGNASSSDSCPANQYCIQRSDTGGTSQIVAANMASGGLQFRYYQDENTTPVASTAVTDWTKVRAVQVVLTGSTIKEVSEVNNVDRQRTLASVADIRNR